MPHAKLLPLLLVFVAGCQPPRPSRGLDPGSIGFQGVVDYQGRDARGNAVTFRCFRQNQKIRCDFIQSSMGPMSIGMVLSHHVMCLSTPQAPGWLTVDLNNNAGYAGLVPQAAYQQAANDMYGKELDNGRNEWLLGLVCDEWEHRSPDGRATRRCAADGRPSDRDARVEGLLRVWGLPGMDAQAFFSTSTALRASTFDQTGRMTSMVTATRYESLSSGPEALSSVCVPGHTPLAARSGRSPRGAERLCALRAASLSASRCRRRASRGREGGLRRA